MAPATSAKPIRIAVQDAEGELPVLHLEVGSQSTVYAVKCLVAEDWKVPPVCQVMILKAAGAGLVEDNVKLVDWARKGAENGELILTMHESYEELDWCLKDNADDVRLVAIRLLKQVAARNYSRALDALCQSLEDRCPDLRQASIEVLMSVAKLEGEDGEDAVDLLVARLADADDTVAKAAIFALSQVVEPADRLTNGYKLNGKLRPMAVKMIGDLLVGHWRGVTRRTAVQALELLAKPKDAAAIEYLCTRLEDPDVQVQEAMFHALSVIAPRGDPTATQLLNESLESTVSCVRVLVIRVFADIIAVKEDQAVVDALLKCLQDPEACVRQMAARGLAQLAPKDNEGVVSALCERLGPPPPEKQDVLPPLESAPSGLLGSVVAVLQDDPTPADPEPADGGEGTADAASTASKVSDSAAVENPEGEKDTIEEKVKEKKEIETSDELLPVAQGDSDAGVRQAAVEALVEVAAQEDERTAQFIAGRLTDTSGQVRRAAVETLARAKAMHKGSVATILRFIDHELADVRWAAVEALGAVAPADDAEMTQILIRCCMEDMSANIRQAAIKVLPSRVTRGAEGNAEAILEAVLLCLRHGSAQVRTAALAALPKVTEKGRPDPRAVEAVVARIRDKDTTLAAVAIDTLAALSSGVR